MTVYDLTAPQKCALRALIEFNRLVADARRDCFTPRPNHPIRVNPETLFDMEEAGICQFKDRYSHAQPTEYGRRLWQELQALRASHKRLCA